MLDRISCFSIEKGKGLFTCVFITFLLQRFRDIPAIKVSFTSPSNIQYSVYYFSYCFRQKSAMNDELCAGLFKNFDAEYTLIKGRFVTELEKNRALSVKNEKLSVKAKASDDEVSKLEKENGLLKE